MKPLKLLQFAAMGALVLGVAFGPKAAMAQVDFDAGVPETIEINAEVDNTITATVTEPDLGTLGVVASTTAGEQAIWTINPDGTFDRTAAVDGASRIVDDGSGLPGGIDIAAGGAFNNTPIYVTYQTPVNLDCALCTGGNPDLLIFEITDDLASGIDAGCPAATAVSTVLDTVTPANNQQGCAATAVDGALAINVGVTIATVDGTSPRPIYETGIYLGSFDAIVEY